MSMRVLLIADAGDGLLDLALCSQRAGHQVKFFCRKFHQQTRPIGAGLVDRVPDWRPWMPWSDIVILENNGVYMAEMDSWRARGCLIIGGNQESAAWELDRKKGMEVFKRTGISVPPYREFTDYDAAISFVERRGEVYYSKPCSDTADKSLSAKTGIAEDPAWQLRKWKKKHGRPPCPFLLQEAIDGIEFAVGAWFGPAGFAEGWEENFEHKKFCSGDVGPNTGEMGTVMRYVKRSKIAEQVLHPLEERLGAIGYCGNVDVNAIVDSTGTVWPLEFTIRLGWPAFNIEANLFACDPIEFFHALASGESTRGAHRLNEVAVGVVAAIPPYPHPPRDYEEIVGVPIYGVDAEDGWHPCEVMGASGGRVGARVAAGSQPPEASERVPRSYNPHLQAASTSSAKWNTMHIDTAAKNNFSIMSPSFSMTVPINMSTAGHYVGVAVGTGDTVRQAAHAAYRALDKLSMPCSPFWRHDIGARLKKELPQLQEHGFAVGMEF